MLKIKTKNFKKYNVDEENLGQTSVTWWTHNSWYETGIKKISNKEHSKNKLSSMKNKY